MWKRNTEPVECAGSWGRGQSRGQNVVYDITLSTVHCVLRQAVPSMFFLSLWDMSRWQYRLLFTTEEVDPKGTSKKPPLKTQNKKTPENPQVMC